MAHRSLGLVHSGADRCRAPKGHKHRGNATVRKLAPKTLLSRPPLRNIVNLHAASNSATSDSPVATSPTTGNLDHSSFSESDSQGNCVRPLAVGIHPPRATFQRAAGAPAPAAVTAAAVAAAVASAENSSQNTRVSAKYRPFLDAWAKGYDFNAQEEPEGAWLQVTDGQLPAGLTGTFFRNGPGCFTRGQDSAGHPYDGDGLVASVALPGDGRAFFRSAFVRTAERQAEVQAGQLLFRGALASPGRGGLLGNAGNVALRNAANAGVVLQGGRLLALYPGGLPYALDPVTLVTRGSQDRLGGALSPGVPLSLASPAADRAMSRVTRLLGSNDRLPPAHSALGGDACGARPRTCSVTGRRVFWSHQTLLAGVAAAAPLPQAAAATAKLKGGEYVAHTERRAGGKRQGRGGGGGGGQEVREEEGGTDTLALLGTAARWLARRQQDRFDTEFAFWEVEPDDDLDPGLDPDRDLVPDSVTTLPQQLRQHQQLLWQLRGSHRAPRRRRSLRYRMKGFAAATVLDVAVTPNYYLLLQPPVHPEVLPYLLGDCGPVSCLKWREGEPAVLHVVPRPGSEADRRGERPVQLHLRPAVCVLHHVNAFEDESYPGRLVLDSVAYDSLPAVGAQPLAEQAVRSPDPDSGCRPRLQRLVIDLPSGTITRRAVPGDPLDPLDPTAGPGRHLELPTFNTAYTGRRYRYVYGCSVVFEDGTSGLVKADLETPQLQRWSGGPGYICLEPCFVPRDGAAAGGGGGGGLGASVAAAPTAAAAAPAGAGAGGRQRSEDDGWLLVYGFDSNTRRSELLVFDTWAMMAGPVARLALPSPLPHGLYGTWTNKYFGPQE
ncbi:hypothetical protein VOLCADRAFT_115826 [Volvox carteri f. nagariensis]|uniref:Carotenoid oxygenase n=1 Tax=Volvox carteri f. nagariensis TaxID=3068 RepID=D8TIJ5_VOLCA|nr:uncharacterized protein VOLCADRAFT_115826 [Volvox carteri f. nagariensis]EFJ53253.1 hypothetical protein VOLCADRAFT_115826 [Volvox carteri f. nagariensis]|eukprot:XP_002946258.1 hypothetical protein VOLCADRAFT_115826 [Volvox carteri f. nagariensis]